MQEERINARLEGPKMEAVDVLALSGPRKKRKNPQPRKMDTKKLHPVTAVS
jgi:hypothetical protein